MDKPHSNLTRRRLLTDSAAIAAGITAASIVPSAEAQISVPEFRCRWEEMLDRVWVGREYWANPMQDWRIHKGRLECINAALNRNVHVLTRALGEKPGTIRMSMRVGRLDEGDLAAGKGTAGFRLGVKGPLNEYRNNLIFGTGLNAGINAAGKLFIGAQAGPHVAAVKLYLPAVELRLAADPVGEKYKVTLAAHDPKDGSQLAAVTRQDITGDQLTGNLSIVANFGDGTPGGGGGGEGAAKGKAKKAKAKGDAGAAGGEPGTFWFSDWRITGGKVAWHEDRAFGPVLFSQYTIHENTLKITAQMPALGELDNRTVRLDIAKGAAWAPIAEAPIHPTARTATFKIPKWNPAEDLPYRLVYVIKQSDGGVGQFHYAGVFRRDPVDQPVISVADISCNFHSAFPNHQYVARVHKSEPDLLAFVGDQFYESTGGYGVQRAPLEMAILDYLRKWYMHGWTWGDLTRERPSVCLPDDHDVYQGNIWGESGAPQGKTQEQGGYQMPPEWINVVHTTQTSHHPDPADPAPIKQNISVYFGPLTWGKISFAILADRQFKSGPEGKVPDTGNRGDHIVDPTFDTRKADLPGLQLLGERQIKFLQNWAQDWRGAEMKAVISQTIFTGMATHHGGGHERLYGDYDCNGWPQTARNQALAEIRKCFAFHIAGDQHLPALIHYGVDEPRDAAVAFAGPAVNVGYPRWWEPDEHNTFDGKKPASPTGDFKDAFGNHLAVLAAANGALKPRQNVLEMCADKASGYGIVRFDKTKRTITIECWPYLADPTDPNASQYPGWPVTVSQKDNYGKKPKAFLPTLRFGQDHAIVQVIDEADGRIVYTLRIAGREFQPMVFSTGSFTVRTSDGAGGPWREFKGLLAAADNAGSLELKS